MTSSRWLTTRLSGIAMAAAGLLIGLLAGSAGGLGTISPARLAGFLAGGLLLVAGLVLAFRPPDDPRRPLRYVGETVWHALDSLGEGLASPRAALRVMVPWLFLATLLRLHNLTFQSLWLDELMTWWRSSYPDLSTVLRSVESDVWAPGHSLLVYGLIHTLGASEFVLRFPPAMAGVLAVAAIYPLGRRLGGHLAGLFSAVLIGVLEISIYYSQEARPYSALILFTIVSTYFWLRGLDWLAARREDEASPLLNNRRYLDLALYVLAALLAMYWNYYGLVVVALQAAGAGFRLIRKPRVWPVMLGVYVVIAIGYVPWMAPTLADLGRPTYIPTRPGGYLDELMQFLRFLFNLSQGYVLGAIGLVAAALAADLLIRRRARPARWGVWLLLAGWLLLPFSLTYVRALNGPSTLLHRYLLISLPAAALLPALALTRLPIRRWMQAGLLLVGVLLLLNNLVRHWDYYSRVTKAQFREATAEVARRDPTLDGSSYIIGFTGYTGTEGLFDFYFAQDGSPRRVQFGAGFDGDAPAVEGAVAALHPRYIWLLAAQNPPGDNFLSQMAQTYHLLDHRAFNAADVWLYAVP